MNYNEFVEKQKSNFPHLEKIVNLLKSLKGKKIITFSHDDPDGVTSASVFKRLTDKLGIENKILFPTKYELSEQEVKDAINKYYYPSAIFILDKGTIEYYKNYVEIVKNIVIIDHHPVIGNNFENLLVFNPSIEKYTQCSGSLLLNILFNLFESSKEEEDFITLIGLKSDWAIDPLNNIIPEFVKPFYEYKIIPKFEFLVVPEENLSSTIFEITSRQKSNLLNHLAQLFFAITGGGFQYFYNDRSIKLKDIYQPEFCFNIFMNKLKIEKFSTIDEFINLLNDKEKVSLIYEYFLDDIKSTENLFDQNTVLGKKINDVELYLFFGKQVRLMPMVGSVKLYEYAKGKEAAIIMFNIEKNGSVHISFRGNTDKIHLGKLANDTAQTLVKEFGHPNEITGGGHPRAAELRTRESGVCYVDILKTFFELVKKI